MTLKGIIFDMDGVLFDTEKFYYDRRETFLNERGISIDHLPPSFFIGGNMKQVWQNILKEDYDKWDVETLQKDYNQYKQDHPLPYCDLIFPDTRDMLSACQQSGLKIGIASSSTKKDILKALRDNDLEGYFQVILSGEEFPESKPNPAIYLEASRRLMLDKGDLVIVEDSEKGIQAGVSAGIEVFGVRDERFGMNQEKASKLFSNLTEIKTYLALD
ncbi:HAD family hydrolase [Streptococcus saliviloxodontae]|uniref:HAD superfamily hydrolase (TIGR01509 family) n=1 Tax=Streptococcus saliviloxodontae TaxID=1349416 RepID=A0ABS2PLY8_9STRE|nr:HAD family phosphatase [Streptococcus saliviloxodontae]MBM7636454.1 HAD superfamily hydrolase (TIGR01509 family) [Streptococcus saliviloxodontae]